jgi:hypothetical protein
MHRGLNKDVNSGQANARVDSTTTRLNRRPGSLLPTPTPNRDSKKRGNNVALTHLVTRRSPIARTYPHIPHLVRTGRIEVTRELVLTNALSTITCIHNNLQQ